MNNKKENFKKGIIDAIPLIIGFLPVSMTFAIMALQSGLTLTQTVAMSAIVITGVSQFIALDMLVLGASVYQIVITTFIVNLRHMVMSMAVANK